MGKSTRMRNAEPGGCPRQGSDPSCLESMISPDARLHPHCHAARHIAVSWEALEMKTDTLGNDLGILRDDHRQLAEQVTTVEREIVEVAPARAATDGRVSS
ncbi:hypothetical protein NDU88_011210 [Pleurodeles waltl]|uniref:Uncharacterized protein n=1 Tax=Pleurodeles waltl TaxID=8319 RepID=A0AAV7QWX4_PLEWA|nr:hypothetical protein NDU88_011210 [Pleurodeles waltl]